jgi:hypothetical protein
LGYTRDLAHPKPRACAISSDASQVWAMLVAEPAPGIEQTETDEGV